ncbi:MAG: Manganese-binding lipoprotein MntA [Actinomycetota bacterium]|jgi:zinc/manganese transport system substrate-binding protein
MHSRTTARLLALFVALAVVPSALTACSPGAAQPTPATAKLRIVASTSVWGSVIEAIGGDNVRVSSIVSNPNQDPHSFEASVRDQAAINSADLIFETGNGYDSFMDKLVTASGQPPSHVVALAPNDKTVKPLYGHTVSDPHVWYDFDIVARAADDITAQLSRADDLHAESFAAGNKTFQAGLVALETRLDKASYRYTCGTAQMSDSPPCKNLAQTSILQPESVGLRLIKKFVVDLTPQSARQAVMNGSDISVQDMALMKTMFFGETVNGSLGFAANTPVNWLVLNSQQSGAQLNQLTSWAKQAVMTRIVTFSETLPNDKTFLTWMADNVAQIEAIRDQEPVL